MVFFLIPIIFYHYFPDYIMLIYMISLFSIFTFYKMVRSSLVVDNKVFYSVIFIFIYTFISFTYFNYETNPLDTSQGGHFYNYISAITFFLFIIYFSFIGKLDTYKYKLFFKIFFYISLSTILLESFLVNLLNLSPSFIPTYRDSIIYTTPYDLFSYLRPFGLTGSAPVNGVIMVMLMWINYINFDKSKYIYFSILPVILTASGTAYVCLLVSLIYYGFKVGKVNRTASILSLFIVTSFFVYLNQSGFQKVDINYILSFVDLLRIEENIFSLDLIHILFGGLGNYPEIYLNETTITEWFIVYSISRFGLITILIIWIYLILNLFNTKYYIVFIIIFIGSLHVGTLYYMPTILILMVLIESLSKQNLSIKIK